MKKSLFFIGLMYASFLNAQIGQLLWQEDFNDLNGWIIETGNGSWGWGNGELEFYQGSNVFIDSVPGEAGNNALHILARKESGANIVDQWGNPLDYTSGRINSKSEVSMQFGMVETRVRIPNLDLGGWPAFWLLGTSNYTWPRCGELDMMEMGHKKTVRDQHDTHNGGSGQNNSTVNQMVASNAMFYDAGSINTGNPLGAASTAWDPQDVNFRPYYDQTNGLVDRFLIYRMYWDPNTIRFTVIDNGVEHDLYENEFVIDSLSREFHQPFYFVMNMAIGGAFTDAFNLGDPTSGQPVSMNLPAEMLVDYIKVYEWNGHGNIHLGPPTGQTGTYGLFTDNTPYDNTMRMDSTGHIYVWEGTLAAGSEAPYEGPNGISWTSTGAGWFGAGIMSVQPLNLSAYEQGNLHFSVKIPANVDFQVGIMDAWGNQSWVEFPANQTKYGLQRDGQWGQATIPVSDIRGTLIDLRMLSYPFAVLEVNGASASIALDDIYWSGGSMNIADRQAAGLRSLEAFPNPSAGEFTLRWTQQVASSVQWEVRNSAGALVMLEQKDLVPSGEREMTLDASNWAEGVYFVTRTDRGSQETLRLVLTK